MGRACGSYLISRQKRIRQLGYYLYLALGSGTRNGPANARLVRKGTFHSRDYMRTSRSTISPAHGPGYSSPEN